MKRVLLFGLSLLIAGCATAQKEGGKTLKPSSEKYTDKIVAVKVDKIPLKNPSAAEWLAAPTTTLKMLPQIIITPKQPQQSVKDLTVKAVYTDREFALLLSWEDRTKDIYDYTDRFTDKVAVQFPLDPENLPSYMMGNRGGRVHIVMWKALWQEDVERGYVDVNDIYPNYMVNMYPYVNMGEDTVYLEPPRITEFSSLALMFLPGYAAGNPDIDLQRKWPVMEYSAEGFGTLTAQRRQDAKGWGIYKEGRWYVIIVVPRASADENNAPIYKRTSVAFAVWDGSSKDRGSRKNYTMWIPVELKP